MKKKLILFDLDGTLVNTRDFVMKTLNKLSDEFGYDYIDDHDIQILRNTRSRNFLKVLGIPIWKAPFLIHKVKKLLTNEIDDMNFVGGMEEVLIFLKQNGHTLGVFTSNSKINTSEFLKKYHGKYFESRYTGIGIFGKQRVFKEVIKENHLSSRDVIYVGDETRDIVASKKAGIKIIAVTWGFNTEKILNSMSPDYIANKPEEIITILS